ncbi:ATP-binding protein [Streptomyces racemochromogenes]|uniref:ATP-binding protein n=1 Tax=Streptomyces racemochromogenes TaxID=67353 RepID=A0ABW7PMP2_9ACTN
MRAVGWAHSFPVAAGARAARVWTAGHLESLDWARDAPDTVHSVLLAVSELVTNAHVHAASTAHLVLTWDGRCLHVSVADADPNLPRPRRSDERATSGRGLAIVAALADTWDVHPGEHRKTITACFRPPGGTQHRDGTDLHGTERRDGPP